MENWFLDNLQKLVPIVIFLLYIFGSAKGKKKASEKRAPDPKADDRARRIQEEIRRKILERQQRGNVPQSRQSEPTAPAPFERAQPLHPQVDRSAREVAEVDLYPRAETEDSKPIFVESTYLDPYEEQRAQVEEKLRIAKELKAKLQASEVAKKVSHQPDDDPLVHRDLRSDIWKSLEDQESIRRAIVLKEILDPPLAMR